MAISFIGARGWETGGPVGLPVGTVAGDLWIGVALSTTGATNIGGSVYAKFLESGDLSTTWSPNQGGFAVFRGVAKTGRAIWTGTTATGPMATLSNPSVGAFEIPPGDVMLCILTMYISDTATGSGNILQIPNGMLNATATWQVGVKGTNTTEIIPGIWDGGQILYSFSTKENTGSHLASIGIDDPDFLGDEIGYSTYFVQLVSPDTQFSLLQMGVGM